MGSPDHFDRPLAPLTRVCSGSCSALFILILLIVLMVQPDLVLATTQRQNSHSSAPAERGVPIDHPLLHRSSGTQPQPPSMEVTFTGNARSDFVAATISVMDDGNLPNPSNITGEFEESDVRSVMTMRSGFDMRMIYWQYDVNSDVMYVGVDCYGVCGDADGDGLADSASLNFVAAGGTDTASLSYGEFFFIALDTSAPPSYTSVTGNVLIGSDPHLLTSTGYNSFGVFVALHPESVPSSINNSQSFLRDSNFIPWRNVSKIEQLVDPATRVASHAGNASFGDIEFIITSFSKIPGLNWNADGPVTSTGEPGYGKMAFSFVGLLGSTVTLSTVGIDFLPNQSITTQSNPVTVGRRIIFECPFLPLDPLGQCCKSSDRDFCGVCNGENKFLDVCGSCRLNASAILPSSCPGAASQVAQLNPSITPLPTEIPSVATLDFNSDGNQEVVLGFPESQIVVIQFFDSEGNVTLNQTISNPNSENSSNDQFGFTVAAIGDVNGDNVPDLAVGAPGFANIGRVYIFLMASDGTVLETRIIESIITTPFGGTYSSPMAASPGPPTSEETYEEPSPSCSEGILFGSSIVWLGRSFLLISAPGAPAQNTTTLPTPFVQQGSLLLTALATDGNTIGTYILPTIIESSIALTTGLPVQNITRSTLGKQVRLAGTLGSSSRLVVSVLWRDISGNGYTSLLMINVQTDGSVTGVDVVRAPNTTQPLPSSRYAPLLNNSTILPPNLIPEYRGANFSLAGAGDIDGDGVPDIVLGIQARYGRGLLLVCFLDNNYVVNRTQLLGPRGVGHLMVSLPSDYVLGMQLATISSTSRLGGLKPSAGSTTLLVTATGPNSPLLLYPISLWGTSFRTTPGTPATLIPSTSPAGSALPTPFGISPSSIVPPSPQYPVDHLPPADPVVIQFVDHSPILTVTSQSNTKVWAKFSFSKIVERSSQNNDGPLKSLFFPAPSTWARQVSQDGTQTFFTSKLVDSLGTPSSVEVQVQVITFASDNVILFSPTTYLGAVKNTVKFSLLVRGWTFTKPKTVLDIIMDTEVSHPILGINVAPSTSSTEKTTRFAFVTTEGEFQVSIPSFASVDGILSSVSTPSFNQALGQFIMTAPPFFDTLFYDPDVTIRAKTEPSGIKKGGRSTNFLLYVIVPSVVGVICIIALIAILGTWICKHQQAERRWKDAGALASPALA